jgi:hypothetical protein
MCVALRSLLSAALLTASVTMSAPGGVAAAQPAYVCSLDHPDGGLVTLGEVQTHTIAGGVVQDVTLPSVHGATATAAAAIEVSLRAGTQAYLSSTRRVVGAKETVACLSTFSNGRYLSIVQIDTYDGGPSAAHPYNYLRGYVFDEASGSLLTTAQLFRTGTSWAQVLVNDTNSDVVRKCAPTVGGVSPVTTLFSSADVSLAPAVTPGRDGLHVDYQPGSVGPEACGVISTVVSYDALAGTLNPVLALSTTAAADSTTCQVRVAGSLRTVATTSALTKALSRTVTLVSASINSVTPPQPGTSGPGTEAPGSAAGCTWNGTSVVNHFSAYDVQAVVSIVPWPTAQAAREQYQAKQLIPGLPKLAVSGLGDAAFLITPQDCNAQLEVLAGRYDFSVHLCVEPVLLASSPWLAVARVILGNLALSGQPSPTSTAMPSKFQPTEPCVRVAIENSADHGLTLFSVAGQTHSSIEKAFRSDQLFDITARSDTGLGIEAMAGEEIQIGKTISVNNDFDVTAILKRAETQRTYWFNEGDATQAINFANEWGNVTADDQAIWNGRLEEDAHPWGFDVAGYQSESIKVDGKGVGQQVGLSGVVWLGGSTNPLTNENSSQGVVELQGYSQATRGLVNGIASGDVVMTVTLTDDDQQRPKSLEFKVVGAVAGSVALVGNGEQFFGSGAGGELSSEADAGVVMEATLALDLTSGDNQLGVENVAVSLTDPTTLLDSLDAVAKASELRVALYRDTGTADHVKIAGGEELTFGASYGSSSNTKTLVKAAFADPGRDLGEWTQCERGQTPLKKIYEGRP